MFGLFDKTKPVTSPSTRQIAKENRELKKLIKEFKIKLHWKGVAAYRSVELIEAYDEHFKTVLYE